MNALVSFGLCTLSNDELLKKIDEATDKMFQDQQVPTRHIPARPNDDYDLLVGELIKRFQSTSPISDTQGVEEKLPLTELIDIRNKLYNDLPTGEINAWELLQQIKWHINTLDVFLSQWQAKKK